MDRFLNFSESLKLSREATFESESGKNMIDDIYTDLLPNNGVIKKVNLPRTTIVTGRKGTGKSTIFQKSISDKTKDRKAIPVYVDTKTVYGNSTPSIHLDEYDIIPDKEIVKYFVYTNFMKSLIDSIRETVYLKLNQNRIVKLLGLNDEKFEDIKLKLDEIKDNIDDVFKRIDLSLVQTIKEHTEQANKSSKNIAVDLSNKPKLTAGAQSNHDTVVKKEFNNILFSYLDIKNSLIENLLKIKEIIKIKYIFVYLDDFSELDLYAQELIIDNFVAPLNNYSKDFVKFKIAAYPKRFYYGELDNQKIDEISLDFFDAYYTYDLSSSKMYDIARMENLALDYTCRLIENRRKVFFPDDGFYKFFTLAPKTLHQLLFEVSLNIPRKLGYILSFCYLSCVINNKKISKKDIENASIKYYDTIISRFFTHNPFLKRPFEDKVSIENQKTLLIKIIERQVENRKSILKSNEPIFNVPKKPASHFIVNEKLAYLLDNLELNNYLTIYNKIKDTTGAFTHLYALDYGMCKKNNIPFGRPKDGKHGKYYKHSRFNFSRVIMDHFNTTQILKCNNGHEFPYSFYEDIEVFDFNCPKCLKNHEFVKCEVTVHNQEILDRINELEQENLHELSFAEFLVLDSFSTMSPLALSSYAVAEYVNKTESSVKLLINKLIDKSLIVIDEEISKGLDKDHYKITKKAMKYVEKINTILGKKKANSQVLYK